MRNRQFKLLILLLFCGQALIGQHMNVTFCTATDEVSPVNDGNGNDQRHKGAMILDYIKVKRFGGSTAPIIFQLSKEPGDPVFDDGIFLDDCFNNNINTNCNGCGTCRSPQVNNSNYGSLDAKFEKGVRVRGEGGNLRIESSGRFNQVCYTTPDIDLSNYKKNSLSLEIGWEGTEEDGFAAKNILIYYTYNNDGDRKWLKIINSSSLVLGKNSTSLSKTEPVPENDGGGGGGCADAFNFSILDYNNQADGIQFPVKLVSTRNGDPSYDITYKNGSYDYSCEFTLPSNKSDYYLEPKYNEKPWDKVSTRDLVVILNQLLEKKTFTKQEMKIAADVNNNGNISTTDISEARKVILGKLDEFRKVESYRFWNADQDFSGNTDLLTVPVLEESIALTDVLNKSASGNFRTVKMGDLTTLESLQGIETRNDHTLELVTRNIEFTKGETATIELKLNSVDIEFIRALQGSFKIKDGLCKVNSIIWEGVEGLHSYFKSPDDLRFLWVAQDNFELSNAPSIQLNITALQDFKLNEALLWNNVGLEGKYTDNNILEGDLSLRFEEVELDGFKSDFIISPNPIRKGVIRFESDPTKDIIKIRIVSNSGKTHIYNYEEDMGKTNGIIEFPIFENLAVGCHHIIIDYHDNTMGISKFINLN